MKFTRCKVSHFKVVFHSLVPRYVCHPNRKPRARQAAPTPRQPPIGVLSLGTELSWTFHTLCVSGASSTTARQGPCRLGLVSALHSRLGPSDWEDGRVSLIRATTGGRGAVSTHCEPVVVSTRAGTPPMRRPGRRCREARRSLLLSSGPASEAPSSKEWRGS